MKRIICFVIAISLLFAMVPVSAYAVPSRSLVLLPWYCVESVEEDGVTLNLEGGNQIYGDLDSELTLEASHRLVVAERIISGTTVSYKAVSSAKSTNDKLELIEGIRSEPLSGGNTKLLDYGLKFKELGIYTIEYDGMTAELEIILPILGYYSEPKISMQTWLNDYFIYDKNKENILYIMIPEEVGKHVTIFDMGNEYTKSACSLEPLEGYDHCYKVTVHKPGKPLYFRYLDAYGSGKGDSIQIVEKPDRVILRSPSTSSKHSVTVKWKKQKCDGYQVQIATNSKFTKGVKTYRIKNDETLKKTVKSLKKGKKYYMRVRAYENVGEYIYGRWSKYKAITCK